MQDSEGSVKNSNLKMEEENETYPFQAPVQAPVALPGLTKKCPSYSIAWNLPRPNFRIMMCLQVRTLTHVCVPPLTSTSTSICRAIDESASRSPVGIDWWPCIRPIRIGGCVTVAERGNEDVWELMIIGQAVQ